MENDFKNMENDFKLIIAELEQLLAVEQLEYHDKTWLDGSDASRSERKQGRLRYIIAYMKEMSSKSSENHQS